MTLTIEEMPFRRIPHLSELYLSYLEHSPRALAFYQRGPDLNQVESASRNISALANLKRREIAAILKRQNAQLGGDAANQKSIAELERGDCVTVVTGQQVGLFGGPLYTVYKTLTALQLTAELRRRGIRAIPVFWMDSEDHDLAEVTHLTALGPDDAALSLDFRDLLFGAAKPSGRPVGSIRLPQGITAVLKEFTATLPDAEFKHEAQSRLEQAYRPETSLADAFGRLILDLFRNTSLVIFNPQDLEAKRLLHPLFRRAIENSRDIHGELMARNQALENAGFVPQACVLESSTLLFLNDGEQRQALTRLNDRFVLKNTDRVFTAADLLNLVDSSPELFSPNVLLRPLVQDHLFPTAAYVAGPSEVAYFAQAETLYRLWGRPMPVIWPRAGFTLVEPETSQAMERFAIGFEDLFPGKQHLMEKAVQVSDHSRAALGLNALEQDLAHNLDELRPVMAAVDASLDHAAETAKNKILYHIEAIRGKFARLEASRNNDLLRAVGRILDTCYPNRNLQERELSVHPFLARYGLPLLDAIGDVLIPEAFTHHVVHLK